MTDTPLPRVWLGSGTPEEVGENLQQIINEDGIGMDGKPLFEVVALTQSAHGKYLTVLVIRRPNLGISL